MKAEDLQEQFKKEKGYLLNSFSYVESVKEYLEWLQKKVIEREEYAKQESWNAWWHLTKHLNQTCGETTENFEKYWEGREKYEIKK